MRYSLLLKIQLIVFLLFNHSTIFSQTINHETADVYFKKALKMSNAGDYKKAISYYDTCITYDPNYADSYFNRARCIISMKLPSTASEKDYIKKNNEAVKDLSKALDLGLVIPDVYILRGIAYMKMDESEKAIVDFDKAIKMDSKYGLAYYNRGVSKLNMKQKEKGCADIRKAIEVNYSDIPENYYEYCGITKKK